MLMNDFWYIIYILLALCAHKIIYRFAHSLGLIAEPNIRSSHKGAVPSSGGLVIFLPLAIIFLFSNTQFENLGLLCIFCLVTFGLIDDRIDINHKFKFIIQMTLSSIYLHFSDSYIVDLFGLFGINEINIYLAKAISLITIVGIVNALNLIDGIDGLAGLISLYSICAFRLLIGNFDATSIYVSLGIIIFLFLNFRKVEKIFLGDSGSMAIGFLIAISVFELYSNETIGIIPIANPKHKLFISVVILSYPLIDTIRVFSLRILNGSSPFQADKRHIHHNLLRANFSHSEASHLILMCSIFFSLFNIFLIEVLKTETIIGFDILLILLGNLIFKKSKIPILKGWRLYHRYTTWPVKNLNIFFQRLY